MKQTLTIPMASLSRQKVLEKIKKVLSEKPEFFHVVSLNPENVVVAYENPKFEEIVRTAQMTIVDGVGVAKAAQLAHVPVGERLTGVELMEELLEMADRMRLTVGLIGGSPNLALELAKCYGEKYAQAKFFGLEGFKNIRQPTKNEEETVLSIVAARRPHLLFASFGSPYQELWLASHASELPAVCIGVGGAFDFLSGRVQRAPQLLRSFGLEWLFRLIVQPWRWRRQLRLLKFCYLVFTKQIQFVAK